ncbi:MAG TPA: PadR family transcriptional regulator [Dehalococcoidia bacterium]|nr:PadR family transcriptional regulator [Dehalococcoidia bacterium]
MSMKHALLGFLSYKPMTGYELKQAFDSTVHFFWNAELSQIYPALKQMERDGLLTMHIEPQSDRPNRKVYELTDAGHAALIEWMQEPTDLPIMKDAFLIKVFFGAALQPELMRQHLNEQLDAHRERLRYYETSNWESLRDIVARNPTMPDPNYWVLTLEWALRYERTCIEWCEWALDRLDRIGEDATRALEMANSRSS